MYGDNLSPVGYERENEKKQGGRIGMKDKILCAWCGETLRTDSPVADSHGICEECKKRLLEEVRKDGRYDQKYC